MSFPVIADSGANYHMFKEREFFDTLSPASGNVLLGDGKTALPIQGVGTVTCQIGDHVLTIPNVRYIMDLGESIYSLFVDIKTRNHGLESSFDTGSLLKFPEFCTKALIGQDDIYVDMKPLHSRSSTNSNTTLSPESTSFCQKLSELTENVDHETKQLDNILRELQHYYANIKTKCQLGFDVPEGFCRDSSHCQLFIVHSPPRKSSVIDSSIPLDASIKPPNLDNFSSKSLNPSSVVTSSLNDADTTSTHLTDSSLPDKYIPIVRSVDKTSSSLPKTMMMTEDFIPSCVGFRRVDTLKKQFKNLYQDTVSIDNTPPDAILDSGCYASMCKKDRNTIDVARPKRFGDVFHIALYLALKSWLVIYIMDYYVLTATVG
jgi:hypothetical protein